MRCPACGKVVIEKGYRLWCPGCKSYLSMAEPVPGREKHSGFRASSYSEWEGGWDNAVEITENGR